MGEYLFPLPPNPSLPVTGTSGRFPVSRIFCVGRNYVSHAAEMGLQVDREAPFYFTKSLSSVAPSGAVIPYPPGTSNFHFEVELVVAIGAPAFKVNRDSALQAVFGYACGLDMTRRDLQQAARAKQHPWDLGKDVENSAVLGEVTPIGAVGKIGRQRIWLKLNEDVRQDARLSELLWSIPEIIGHLSGFYHLGPGDLIFTGTPAGVGPVLPGDCIEAGIDGLASIALTIADAD